MFKDFAPLAYLGGLFLGLFPSSLYMFMIGHLWYGICLAGAAFVCLVCCAIAVMVWKILYNTDHQE